MPTYLDIGCVRIQSWIGQWSDLFGRRGASAALNQATASDSIQAHLDDAGWSDVVINTTVPDIDGVVSLVVGPSTDPQVVAASVLATLRGHVPGAEFEAIWGEGDDYASAYEHEIRLRAERGEVTRALPAPAELPMVARCDLVSTDLAIGSWSRAKDERPRRVGRDAKNRIDGAGFRSSRRRSDGTALDTEIKLVEEFGRDEVRDFDHLAALGPKRTKQNHLATVYLDGNRIGDHFQLLQPGANDSEESRGVKMEARRSLGSELHLATIDSLRAVTGELCQMVDHKHLPVVPHLVGGDDVLVSVPAAYGIWFARRLMTGFASRLAASDTVAQLPQSPGGGAWSFSASAGIVIAHLSHPFGICVAAADDLLARAKAATRGSEAAILVAELTTDSADLPSPAEAWTLSELSDLDPHLTWLARLGKSQRAELHRAAERDDPDVARAYVEQLLRRSGDLDRLPPALIANPRRLVQALKLTRWWT